MQFRLRTLLIVLALGPPTIAFLWLQAFAIVTIASIVGPGVVSTILLSLLLGLACAAVLFALGYT